MAKYSHIDEAIDACLELYNVFHNSRLHPEMPIDSRDISGDGTLDTKDMTDLSESSPDDTEDNGVYSPYESWEQWYGLLEKAKTKMETWREELDGTENEKGKLEDMDDPISPYDKERIFRTLALYNRCEELLLSVQQSIASITQTHQSIFYNGRHYEQMDECATQAFYSVIRYLYYLNEKV